MRKLLIATALATMAAPTAAAPFGTAQNFLDRVNRLKAKGPLALLDADYARLKAEANAAGRSIGADRIAMERVGQAPLYCSPKPRAELGQSEFLRGLQGIPAAERSRLDLKAAMLRILQRKYPCKR